MECREMIGQRRLNYELDIFYQTASSRIIMDPDQFFGEDSTEKVTIIEKAARALKATITLLVYRHIVTRDELRLAGRAKREQKDLDSRLAKLSWIFDSLMSTLEEKRLLNTAEVEEVYSLRNMRPNPDRAAGFAVGHFIAALKVLLECLIKKNLITKSDAGEIMKLK
jgi:hypothetical protein